MGELSSQVIRLPKTDVAGRGYIAQQYTESPAVACCMPTGSGLQNSSSLVKAGSAGWVGI